jgi:anaerobic magnesium-protoporphyrin IX monomethyl ester cyclase
MNFLFVNINQNETSRSSDTIPLSMGYILAYLRRSGYGGVILDDLSDRPLSLRALEMWIRKLEPEAIGFTAYQENMERIRLFSYYVKSHHDSIRVMLGGPQAFFMPSAALRELQDVDIICRGEGETVTTAIAECLQKNEDLSSVDGITFRNGHEIIDTKLKPDLSDDLDRFPSPYLCDIINLEGKHTAIVSTSRGCRYGCLFCISPSVCGRRIRYHSVKRVLDEMGYLVEKGIDRFWFADENFGGAPERVLEILEGKEARGILARFWCETRCDLVDDVTLKRLREAGADTISFGLESANSEVLKGTGKGISLEHLRMMIQSAKSLGLKVELTSIFGLPGETVEKARQTLDFVRACQVPIDGNSRAQQMKLYFGSIYEKNAEKLGFKAIPGYLPSYLSLGDRYETEALTKRDFQKIRNLWFLALEEVRRDVQNREQPFNLLDVLLTNEETLRDERAFYEYGATLSSELEEKELLWRFLDSYVNRLKPLETHLNRLISRLNLFMEVNRGARMGSRIVIDWHSEMGGLSFADLKEGYCDLRLGRSPLPHALEANLIGVHAGERKVIKLRNGYLPMQLRDKGARIHVTIYKVLEPVNIGSMQELRLLNIHNHYTFPDLNRLSQENDVLYHLALKDIPERELVKMPVHFLGHISHYAKLHRTGDIRRMATLLGNDERALHALGEVLYSAGRHAEAAHYYGKVNLKDSNMMIKKARSLFLSNNAEKALNILNSIPEEKDLLFQQLLLECLKIVRPHSERITLLDRNVLRLKVETLEKMDMMRPTAVAPLVHGHT